MKLFTTAKVRGLIRRVSISEISMGRMVEIMNEEVEKICKPIMDEMSKAMGMPQEEKVTNSEPNIDEVD